MVDKAQTCGMPRLVVFNAFSCTTAQGGRKIGLWRGMKVVRLRIRALTH